MFKFVACMLLAILCRNGFAQEEFPFKQLTFSGSSAARRGDHVEYFLFKNRFYPGVRPDEEAALIAEWREQHPKARVVPVSILGESSKFPIVYFWAVDGDDNLNLFLVKKGVYAALSMLDTPQLKQLLQLSKNAPYGEILEAQERAGNPKGIRSRRLVSDPRYKDFLNQLLVVEAAANAEMNGIWSDKFKRNREDLGLLPLNAMPALSLHTENEQDH